MSEQTNTKGNKSGCKDSMDNKDNKDKKDNMDNMDNKDNMDQYKCTNTEDNKSECMDNSLSGFDIIQISMDPACLKFLLT